MHWHRNSEVPIFFKLLDRPFPVIYKEQKELRSPASRQGMTLKIGCYTNSITILVSSPQSIDTFYNNCIVTENSKMVHSCSKLAIFFILFYIK